MFNLRKYSYVILWVTLVLVVATVWVFGKEDTSDYIKDKSETSSAVPKTDEIGEESESSSAEEFEESDSEETGKSTEETTVEREFSSDSENILETASEIKQEKMTGIWIPFMSLSTEEKTEAAFKENFEEIVQTSRADGFNALFVHIRPYSDSYYPSEYFPWTHYLTGEQGVDPDFDPMEFMVEYAHKNDMEFHAWINPLRVKTNETPKNLSGDNPYEVLKNDYPFYFMEYEGAVYLNPAYQYIRTLIANGAAEIVRKYDVDGIHFDDYFYPSEEGGYDLTAYESYVKTVAEPLPLLDWRSANISTMVSEVYSAVKRENPKVDFGISPAGNLDNNMKIGANIYEWCKSPGYIDYICPQLYYSYDNPALGYSQALDNWMNLERHENLKMYIGIGLYKAGSDADDGTWLEDGDIIKRQIEDAEARDTDGVLLYAYDYLHKEETQQEMENARAVLGKVN